MLILVKICKNREFLEKRYFIKFVNKIFLLKQEFKDLK